MTNLYSSFNYLIGKILKKYYSLSLAHQILLAYILVTIPFLYFHEQHLPLGIILILIIFSILFSFLLGYASIWILGKIFEKDFYFWIEILFFGSSLGIFYALGLLENRAAWVFFFIVLGIFLIYRVLKVVVIYRIFFLGTIVLLNGLFSFKMLQLGEWLLFHLAQKLQTSSLEISVEDWEWHEKDRLLIHKTIPVKLKLHSEMFFHKPKGELSEYKGTGNLLAVISNSPSDPTVYPYLRIFFLPSIARPNFDLISEEFENYLNFEVGRGEIESLQSLGEREHEKQKWKGKFWIFYDNLRPRNSKTGFYILPLSNGNILILEIRENLKTNTFHEIEIQEILDSIQTSF